MFNILIMGGTIATAFQAFHQDAAVRQTVLLSAAVGLAASLMLQTVAGTFSKQENRSLAGRIFSVAMQDIASVISGVVLPLAVAFGYLQKIADLINERSMGFFKIKQQVTIGRWEVAQLYPVFVGGNFGFMLGQSIGAVYRHFKTALQ